MAIRKKITATTKTTKVIYDNTNYTGSTDLIPTSTSSTESDTHERKFQHKIKLIYYHHLIKMTAIQLSQVISES